MYFVGIEDNSLGWLRVITGSNWGPKYTNLTQSMFFHDLKAGYSGDVISCKEISLMKVFVELHADPSVGNDFWIGDYDEFDFGIAPNEMEGIDTPVFTETKVPSMPTSGGLLGAVWGAIQDFGNAISQALGPALLGLWNAFVGFLDTALSFTGIPNLFTIILNAIGDFFGWIVDSIAWVITSLTAMFTLLVVTLTKTLSVVVSTITSWVSMIQNGLSLISGGFGQTYNIFIDLRLDLWITIIGIFYAVWLFFLWDEKGLNAVLNHLEMIMNFFAFIIHTFLSIIQFFWSLITGIIEAIPVVE